MALIPKTYTQLVREQATAVQGSASGLVDFSIGSILRALAEAVAQVALWLQGLILNLLAATRASTSRGADLDSWMADYGLSREAAMPALGDVTFSRFSGSGEASIPLNVRVETADGSESYLVALDTGNSSWVAARQAYVMGAGVTSVTVPVEAETPGASGNAAAGAVTIIASAVPGVDQVTNAASFFSGADPETDIAFRARFQLFIASLSLAVKPAVAYAIASLEQNLTHVLVENETYDGEARRGHFYVIVNDGTGSPTSETLSLVMAAIDRVRPVGITFGVFAPNIVDVNVGLSIHLSDTTDAAAVMAAVSLAVEQYIDALSMGGAVRLTRIAQVAYGASDLITNVTGVTLNSQTADVVASAKQLPRAGLITVTVV